MAAEYRVGDKVFYSPNKGVARYVEITKTGRKWAYFGRKDRFDMETGVVDGGDYGSPGHIYPSERDYYEETALCRAWDKFREDVRNKFRCPEGVNEDDIKRARRALRLGGE